jgi:hypothetical protein
MSFAGHFPRADELRLRQAARLPRQPELSLPRHRRIFGREFRRRSMAWCIGRSEAMNDPVAARRKALAKLRGLENVDDPESLVVPILIDAILMAESYRGARHQITFLDEMTRNVDALIRELNAVEKAREWAEPVTGA